MSPTVHGEKLYPTKRESQDGVVPYFDKLGHSCPPHTNPADHVIGVINTDFSSASGSPSGSAGDEETGQPSHAPLEALSAAWRNYTKSQTPERANWDSDSISPKPEISPNSMATKPAHGHADGLRRDFSRTLLLMQRMGVNYRRNLLAYGVRIGMYAGMGFLLATIWVHLGTRDTKINDRLSVGIIFGITSVHRLMFAQVHFFSVAFLGFMRCAQVFSRLRTSILTENISVAGIPSFLEERAVFMRE